MADWFMEGFNNQFWNPVDFLLPGTSFLNKTFDPTGKQAAQAQFDSQLALQQQAQAFNSAEADKSRQWEQMMSNTEVQRRVEDIKAAGLNPYFALTSSIAGSTPSGATAQSSPGSASMANNKIAAAAGIVAMFLRMMLTKH